MTPHRRAGLMLAATHVLLVCLVGGKYLLDRATRPRVWARTAPYDPDLPIRGRYVRLRVEAVVDDTFPAYSGPTLVTLSVRNDALVAAPTASADGPRATLSERNGRRVAVLDEPVAYFIPEHVADPSRRAPGEELWVELTLPSAGPPRPVRLEVRATAP